MGSRETKIKTKDSMKRSITLSAFGARPFLQVAVITLAVIALSRQTEAQPLYSVTDLGALPGAASSVATGLNDRGDVVGYCAPAVENFNEVGFVWRAGVMISTGKLLKGTYSVANAINSFGVVVGDGDTGDSRP